MENVHLEMKIEELVKKLENYEKKQFDEKILE
jgi:hypothetical protein